MLDQPQGVASADVDDVQPLGPLRSGGRCAVCRQVGEVIGQGCKPFVEPGNLDRVVATGGADKADARARAARCGNDEVFHRRVGLVSKSTTADGDHCGMSVHGGVS